MRIIIIDDDPFVCASLTTILQADSDIEVVASATSGEEAIRLYRMNFPDILLMDIQMNGMSGLDAGEKILKTYPSAKILFLTTFSDNEYIIKALRMGAKGYLIKQNIETISPSLKAVMSGQSVFGSEIVTKLPSLMSGQREIDLLEYNINEREKEVIELVAKGFSNKEIADTLYLSEGTIRNYLSTILDKLELRDRTQLAVFYYKHHKGN
ncbi:MAG: degU 2 [Oscillospiraceae bacterium]|jgi:DNA-binding NarL/FixJ family response regulator|nr:degU 2 [Oscillospiraceae bacterium]